MLSNEENDSTADLSPQEIHEQQSHTDPVSNTLKSSKSDLNCDIMSLNESCISSSTFVDEVILKKFKELFSKESRDLIDMIEETRLGMKNSFANFHKSKIKYTSELDEISKEKRELDRRKENAIPLAEYIKKKREKANNTESPAISYEDRLKMEMYDRSAVERYLKKRDRKKTAERYKRDRSHIVVEQEAQKILGKLHEADMCMEEESVRQAELIKQKLMRKKSSERTVLDLLENYNEAEVKQETERRAQLEKIENDTIARKSANTHRSMAMSDIE